MWRKKEGRRIGYAWGRVIRNWKKIEFFIYLNLLTIKPTTFEHEI